MAKEQSTGKCNLCGATFSKGAMTRHITACRAKTEPAPGKSAKPVFHIVVDGGGPYWLHLAVPANATLSKLDGFLRHIWLECCGHMSAFTIDGQRYSANPMGDLDEEGANIALGKVLEPGMKFAHEYDYGSTTELRLKVAGAWDKASSSTAIELLARNNAPQFPCEKCGKGIATQICSECQWSGKGWLCEKCAATHECGKDMFLPVVNSPRTGVCGYTG